MTTVIYDREAVYTDTSGILYSATKGVFKPLIMTRLTGDIKKIKKITTKEFGEYAVIKVGKELQKGDYVSTLLETSVATRAIHTALVTQSRNFVFTIKDPLIGILKNNKPFVLSSGDFMVMTDTMFLIFCKFEMSTNSDEGHFIFENFHLRYPEGTHYYTGSSKLLVESLLDLNKEPKEIIEIANCYHHTQKPGPIDCLRHEDLKPFKPSKKILQREKDYQDKLEKESE